MIEQISWNDEAEAGLKVSAGADMAIIRAQVENGIAQLWRYSAADGGGYIVTRVDQQGKGPELVIVLGEGRGLHDVVPQFIEAAQSLNIKSIRTHVKRQGLIRMYARHGFEVDEYVLRWK